MDLLVAVSLPLFLGVAREFLSPSTLGPLPTELLLLATLDPVRGILDTEEDLLEEEEAPVRVALGIPLDLLGLAWPDGTWSWLLRILCGAWLWLSAAPDSLLCSQDLRMFTQLN